MTRKGNDDSLKLLRDTALETSNSTFVLQRRAEEALRESEGRYRSLCENMLEGYAHCRMIFEQGRPMDFVYLNVNSSFEKLTGLKDVVGRKVTEVIPGIRESYPELFETYARVVRTGKPERFEVYSDSFGGWLAVFVYRVEEECFVAVFENITERKRADEALQKSRDFYLTLFENFPALIWRAGTDKKCDYFNNTWLEFTGRTLEQELGDGWAEGVHPDDLERCVATYVQAFDMREPFRMEYRIRHCSGEFRWIVDIGRSFHDLDGEFAGYIGSCYDITDRRDADEEIRRLNTELELKVEERTRQLLDAQEELVRREKLTILGQLSGCVGHELRNPLGVMSNAVYFLKMVLAEADETTKEYLEIIKREIDNSQRIITDLLDFARTRAPQTRMVTAGELVEQSLGRCTIPECVALRSEVPETLPPLRIDPLQMGQVLQNLITNAVQAMPGGGALRVSACQVRGSRFEVRGSEEYVERRTPNVEPDADFVEISVADSGEGVSPENMKKLFQPLFTTKAKGIGLGLVVCRNLVEANGGRIGVASRLGEGTTFSVLLPVEQAEG